MADIKTLIIEEADRRDLTFAQDFNGRTYALMDADWIGYFDTINEVLEFLGISVEIDECGRWTKHVDKDEQNLDMRQEQNCQFSQDDMSALEMALKVLEQESVLDKIKKEITDWQIDIHDNEDNAEAHDFVFERIYEIIDECRTESEE